jgi:hypothetical protein
MTGERDPHYIVARSVLLDALAALGPQRKAVILVGAQAIYLHTGAIELAVAEYTTDGDITLDPALLRPTPEIESAMTRAGFRRGSRVGAWFVSRDIAGVWTKVEVDLMVPEAIGGPGRRAARLPGHAKHAARKARGLEAALIDKSIMTLDALDAVDKRSFAVAVAGAAALIVSKLHKIHERLAEGKPQRRDDKDALDVLRLLRAAPSRALANTFGTLLHADVSRQVTQEGLTHLRVLFAAARGAGSQMAVRAAGPLASAAEIAESCAALATDLLTAIGK